MFLGRLFQHFGPYMLNEHAMSYYVHMVLLKSLVLEYGIVNYDQTILNSLVHPKH